MSTIAHLQILKAHIILLAVFLGLIYPTLHLVSWKKSNSATRFIPLKGQQDSRTRNCLIALYKSDKADTIILDRVLKTQPWKYLFYTPKEYSKEAFINVQILPDNIKLILAGADTLYKSFPMFHYQVKSIPDNFIVNYKDGTTRTFYLIEKYQDNFDKVADVPFLEKFDSGPLHNDN